MISYDRLWKLLDDQKINTNFLRSKCGSDTIHSGTIERLKRGESVSTKTLDSFCKILNCRLEDIIEFVPDQAVDGKGDEI